MRIDSLSFLGLLATILAPAMAFEACLTHPPPRQLPPSLLEQCSPQVRTQLTTQSITRTSIQRMHKILGDSSRPSGFYNLPCGGLPPDASNKCETFRGASLPVKWATVSNEQGVDASSCECQVSLHSPGTGQAERLLWSGSCAEQERSVKIPEDIHTCMFGDCFLQWKMETGRDTYVNCADLVIHSSQDAASQEVRAAPAGEERDAQLVHTEEDARTARTEVNVYQRQGDQGMSPPPARSPPLPPTSVIPAPAQEKPVYFNSTREDRKEPVTTATVIYEGQPTGTAPNPDVPCPPAPTAIPAQPPSPPMANPIDCNTPMPPGGQPGFGGPGAGFGGGRPIVGPGMGGMPGFGRPSVGFGGPGAGFGGGRPVFGPGMGGMPGFGGPGAGFGGVNPYPEAQDADCH